MPYDLYVTTAKGRTFRTLNSPYDSRHATALSAMAILAAKGVETVAGLSAMRGRVRDARLGATVTHEVSGISFRTEEV